MTKEQFTEFMNERLNKTSEMLVVKGNEYCHGNDRLEAFKTGAEIMRTTPELTCMAWAAKHVNSIYDMLTHGDTNKDMIFEKTQDLINYCYLLQALVYERENEHDN